MKPIILEVKSLIDAGKFPIIDRIFTGFIPKEAQKDTDSTDVLIMEANNSPGDYANNDFTSLNQLVEVQIFYAINVKESISDFEIKLMRFFKKNNWYVDQSKPRTIDPDTEQVTKVFYFYKKLRLKGDI